MCSRRRNMQRGLQIQPLLWRLFYLTAQSGCHLYGRSFLSPFTRQRGDFSFRGRERFSEPGLAAGHKFLRDCRPPGCSTPAAVQMPVLHERLQVRSRSCSAYKSDTTADGSSSARVCSLAGAPDFPGAVLLSSRAVPRQCAAGRECFSRSLCMISSH